MNANFISQNPVVLLRDFSILASRHSVHETRLMTLWEQIYTLGALSLGNEQAVSRSILFLDVKRYAFPCSKPSDEDD